MSFLFAPPAQAVIPVLGRENLFFPVRRVYCVARNYGAHAKEMGSNPADAPFFFMKPTDAVTPAAEGEAIRMPFPAATADLQPEIELVACLSKGGSNLSLEEAQAAVWGWCAGIDFTRRDLQRENSKLGRPWTTAKAFDGSAPVSYVRPAAASPDPSDLPIWMTVNGEKRQDGRTSGMTRSAAQIIAELSKFWRLEPGDIVFTGTPGGVAPVHAGDQLFGGVDGIGTIRVELL